MITQAWNPNSLYFDDNDEYRCATDIGACQIRDVVGGHDEMWGGGEGTLKIFGIYPKTCGKS